MCRSSGSILRYLGTCDGDMRKGICARTSTCRCASRAEARHAARSERQLIRSIGQAIEAEARRQIDIIEDGGAIEQETRLFDSAKGETRSMRSKEEAHDYRYFPDPDLLPLELTQAYVDELKKGLPELPDAKRARFVKDYKLSAYDAGVLTAERESADFFEETLRRAAKSKERQSDQDTSAPKTAETTKSVSIYVEGVVATGEVRSFQYLSQRALRTQSSTIFRPPK